MGPSKITSFTGHFPPITTAPQGPFGIFFLPGPMTVRHVCTNLRTTSLDCESYRVSIHQHARNLHDFRRRRALPPEDLVQRVCVCVCVCMCVCMISLQAIMRDFALYLGYQRQN